MCWCWFLHESVVECVDEESLPVMSVHSIRSEDVAEFVEVGFSEFCLVVEEVSFDAYDSLSVFGEDSDSLARLDFFSSYV